MILMVIRIALNASVSILMKNMWLISFPIDVKLKNATVRDFHQLSFALHVTSTGMSIKQFLKLKWNVKLKDVQLVSLDKWSRLLDVILSYVHGPDYVVRELYYGYTKPN